MKHFIIPILLFASLFLLTASCAMLSSWHNNEYGQLVPDKPAYRLKDMPGLVIPPNLDTGAVYHLVEKWSGNTKVFPGKRESAADYNVHYFDNTYYKLFFAKGRELEVSVPNKKLATGLTSADFDPHSRLNRAAYYYITDGKNLKDEIFWYGIGEGTYSENEYSLSPKGDSLVEKSCCSRSLFVKMHLAIAKSRYPADW